MKKKKRKIKKIGVKNYCKACLSIRNGRFDYSAPSKEDFFLHTCRKTGKELDEFIFHMNFINGMRRFVL